jgi:trimethylamine--corrinoid protein Co-methyltransferase
MRQRRPARQINAIPQRPFGQVPRPYDPIRVLSDDHIEAIHHRRAAAVWPNRGCGF